LDAVHDDQVVLRNQTINALAMLAVAECVENAEDVSMHIIKEIMEGGTPHHGSQAELHGSSVLVN
jgi:hypothetical protein